MDRLVDEWVDGWMDEWMNWAITNNMWGSIPKKAHAQADTSLGHSHWASPLKEHATSTLMVKALVPVEPLSISQTMLSSFMPLP